MQNQELSSIVNIPLLELDDLSNLKPPKEKNFKHRLSHRFTLSDMLELPIIGEQTTDRLSTKRSSVISLSQIRTLRLMKHSSMDSMTEEECIARYAKDPFFRKKIQYQLKQLKGKCGSVMQPAISKENEPLQIQKTAKFIQPDVSITYRKVKQRDSIVHFNERKKYQKIVDMIQQKDNTKRQR